MDDPIIEEVRATRARLLEECGGDIHKLLQRYKSCEALSRFRVVTLEEIRAKRRLEAVRPCKSD